MDYFKLFAVTISGRLDKDHSWDHRTFYAVANKIEDLVSTIKEEWCGIFSTFNIDFYTHIDQTDGFKVVIVDRYNQSSIKVSHPDKKLFHVCVYAYSHNMNKGVGKSAFIVASSKHQANDVLKQDDQLKRLLQEKDHNLSTDETRDIDNELNSTVFCVKLDKIEDASKIKKPQPVFVNLNIM